MLGLVLWLFYFSMPHIQLYSLYSLVVVCSCWILYWGRLCCDVHVMKFSHWVMEIEQCSNFYHFILMILISLNDDNFLISDFKILILHVHPFFEKLTCWSIFCYYSVLSMWQIASFVERPKSTTNYLTFFLYSSNQDNEAGNKRNHFEILMGLLFCKNLSYKAENSTICNIMLYIIHTVCLNNLSLQFIGKKGEYVGGVLVGAE